MEKTDEFPMGKGGRLGTAKVPVPARITETGELIQMNCCLTPWCLNFGRPVGKPTPGAYNFHLNKRKRVGVFASLPAIGRVSQAFECRYCGTKRDILSNRGVAEMAGIMAGKYAPALHCPECTGNELLPAAAPYPWNFYDIASTDNVIVHSAGTIKSGNMRYRCKRDKNPNGKEDPCDHPFCVTHRDFPEGIRDLFENPDDHVQDLHDSSFMTANQFQRSVAQTEAALRVEGAGQAHVRMKPFVYYKVLNWYHFLAVEWLGYFNNQIRASAAKIIGAVSWANQGMRQNVHHEDSAGDEDAPMNSAASAEKEALADTEPEDLAGVELSADDDDKGDLPEETSEEEHSVSDADKMDSFSDLPQVQSDTLELSVATPGHKDKQQEIRLTISVLAPSGYVLLVTTNCVDGPDVNELLQIDMQTDGKYWAHDPELKDREFVMHPHLQRLNDAHTESNRPFLKGTSVTPNFAGKATRVRKHYHASAHYYVLEQILRGIKGEILLSLDGDRENIRACMWAFRDRVKRDECHIVQVSPVKDGGAVGRGDGVKAEMGKLTNEVGKRQKTISRLLKKMSKTSKSDREASAKAINQAVKFKSSEFPLLAQRWNSDSALHKNKTWLTTKSMLNQDVTKAAKILRTASLFVVDSVCNQMRQRIPGFFRGKVGAKRDSHSYVSHSRNPLVLQQRADIFAFSKNCLAWHSLGKGYRPAIGRLEMNPLGSKREAHHLTHYCRMFYTRQFLDRKFNLPKRGIGKS